MRRLRLFEIFLIQVLVYLALWLWNDYAATLFSILMVAIFSGILIVAIIAELIEKSKVPKSYFIFMFGSILIPLLVGFIFISIMGGELEWLE
jgi:FtsH-binding integral membrane protein